MPQRRTTRPPKVVGLQPPEYGAEIANRHCSKFFPEGRKFKRSSIHGQTRAWYTSQHKSERFPPFSSFPRFPYFPHFAFSRFGFFFPFSFLLFLPCGKTRRCTSRGNRGQTHHPSPPVLGYCPIPQLTTLLQALPGQPWRVRHEPGCRQLAWQTLCGILDESRWHQPIG